MARDRAARPGAKPVRLFVAVEVPDETRSVIEAAVAPWREAFPKARWAPRENWHVTLKFLGSTWPRLLDWVGEQVREVAASHTALRTRATRLGCFPSPGRARVLWAGLDDGPGRMAELALALDVALAREFRPEGRAFSPHLTVARSDPPLKLPEGFGATDLASEPFEIDRLVVFRSHLGRPAPRYEQIGACPLG